MQILLVEDDHILCEFLEQLLHQEGHRVTVSTSGPAGLEALRAGPFDMMILDRMLPGLDGLHLLQQARREGFTLPVLMLTALGAPADKVEGLDAGARLLTGPGGRCEVSGREAALLAFLFRNAGQVLPRELLLDRVWGADSEVEEGNLNNYIFFARRRLLQVGSRLQIQTVRGLGYRVWEC